MFYEIHLLDNGVFHCEADDCVTPDKAELIERVWRDEDGETYYSIKHAADWALQDARVTA